MEGEKQNKNVWNSKSDIWKPMKFNIFGCFIIQLVKKLQQWSLYKVIEDTLPLVLNRKRPLSDILLLSYEQNSFGCFLKKL